MEAFKILGQIIISLGIIFALLFAVVWITVEINKHDDNDNGGSGGSNVNF